MKIQTNQTLLFTIIREHLAECLYLERNVSPKSIELKRPVSTF